MYGLLGKTLKHSMSKYIHEYIHPMDYHLMETDDLDTFLKTRNFKGINVTIPYKKAVIPYCDVLDDSVIHTGVVNTIINTNGFLKAYNTDYLALKNIIETHFPAANNTDIAIIGNGATTSSLYIALQDLGYLNLTVYARTPKNKEELSLDKIKSSHTVLINTTPFGMYPNNHVPFPIDLTQLPQLDLVFDVVYNPLKTSLILAAEARNIKTLSGLSMLITQAFYANQYFFNAHYNNILIEETFKYIYKMMINITLIGLPFSGKTTYGKLLGNRYNKTFIDIDEAIIKDESMPITDIFKVHGEAYFRTLESAKTMSISKEINQIISTGGGAVLNPSSIISLKQTSVIVYLDLAQSLMKTIRFHSRPHVQTYEDLLHLKISRHHLYKNAADIIINKDTLDRKVIMDRLEVKINDYINYQWTKSKPFRD
ncbi:MAG: shikimate kinase [Bacillota bacterium]